MYFRPEYLKKIKDRNNLRDLITEYVKLKPGKRFDKGLCPLPNHSNDTEPSFTYYHNDDSAHCYGCNTSITDAIDFVEKMENLTFPESVKYLAKRSNLPLPSQDKEFEEQQQQRQELKDLTAEFWINLTKKESGNTAYSYLKHRGIDDDLIEKFKLGYCDNKYVRHKQYKRFTNRIVFPVHDQHGELAGLSGRVLPGDEGSYPKYMNSDDKLNPLFQKRYLIYGLYKAKKYIRELNHVILVEGYTDVILLHKYGIKNVVAAMGTAITEEQLDILRRFSRNILFFMDPDEAGVQSVLKTLSLIDKKHMTAKIVTATKGKDPAELAQLKKGDFRNWISQNSKTIEQYFVDRIVEQYSSKLSDLKRNMLDSVTQVFGARLENIESEFALSSVANLLEVDIRTLKQMIRKNTE